MQAGSHVEADDSYLNPGSPMLVDGDGIILDVITPIPSPHLKSFDVVLNSPMAMDAAIPIEPCMTDIPSLASTSHLSPVAQPSTSLEDSSDPSSPLSVACLCPSNSEGAELPYSHEEDLIGPQLADRSPSEESISMPLMCPLFVPPVTPPTVKSAETLSSLEERSNQPQQTPPALEINNGPDAPLLADTPLSRTHPTPPICDSAGALLTLVNHVVSKLIAKAPPSSPSNVGQRLFGRKARIVGRVLAAFILVFVMAHSRGKIMRLALRQGLRAVVKLLKQH